MGRSLPAAGNKHTPRQDGEPRAGAAADLSIFRRALAQVRALPRGACRSRVCMTSLGPKAKPCAKAEKAVARANKRSASGANLRPSPRSRPPPDRPLAAQRPDFARSVKGALRFAVEPVELEPHRRKRNEGGQDRRSRA